jgi:hypothetical protein
MLQHIAQQLGDAMRGAAISAPASPPTTATAAANAAATAAKTATKMEEAEHGEIGKGEGPPSSSSSSDRLPSGASAELLGLREKLRPLLSWLQPLAHMSDEAHLRLVELMPSERDADAPLDCLQGACECCWWLTSISACVRDAAATEAVAGGGGAGEGATGAETLQAKAVSMRPEAIRRLGGLLNDLGQLRLRSGELAAADSAFRDGLMAFEEVHDETNAALLLLNRAVVSRQRAARFNATVAAAAAVKAAGVAAAAAAGASAAPAADKSSLAPEATELQHRLDAVEHARSARRKLRQLRGGGPPQLRAMVSRELATGEAAAGGALHSLVAEGCGSEADAKKAGECLSSAQQIYEELGEHVLAQRMMRQQGSLYLAAALCESLAGEGHERAAASKLTLALRHYERALAPPRASKEDEASLREMRASSAEARVELANFYIAWSSKEMAEAAAGAAAERSVGVRVRHLETALQHARAPQPQPSQQQPPAPSLHPDLPNDVLERLAEAEEHALRELIRTHASAGQAARAGVRKEEYRTLLQERALARSTHRVAAQGDE